VQRQHPEWKIVKASHYYRDPQARIGATPDYFIDGDPRGFGVLQCKTVSSSMFRKSWADDQPPFWIALQTQTEIMMTEAAFGIIGVLVVGDYVWRLHEYEVPRHEGAQDRIRKAVAEFWTSFDLELRPTPDYTRDRALIDAIYPNDKPGISIDLRGDNRILELLDEIEQADDDEAAAKAKGDKAKAEIKEKMGDAATALVRGWRVTWKTEEREPYYVPGKSRRVFRSRRVDNG
jgi:predicted phage-related endonuclease